MLWPQCPWPMGSVSGSSMATSVWTSIGELLGKDTFVLTSTWKFAYIQIYSCLNLHHMFSTFFSTWCTWIANSVLTARLRATGSQKALILLERVPDLAVTGAQVAEWIEEVCDQLLVNLLNVHQGNVKKQSSWVLVVNFKLACNEGIQNEW